MLPLRDYFSRLNEVLPADRRELRARLGGLERAFRDAAKVDPRALAALDTAFTRSIQERARRRSLVPIVSYPPELPFTSALPMLREALSTHQVVVVAGETGSGKSTQLGKLCLELGRGVDGRIAHTQPRRIAARSVARRVADELGLTLGGVVGVKVRFNDETGRDTLLKVMTDGMLLAETRADPRLEAYDTILIDEAHERSLNIDFLLGYLKRLLTRRADLKLILTSATIDVARLSAHFGNCPIVEIHGRSHAILQRYRPLEQDDVDEEDPRMLEAITLAIAEIDEHFASVALVGAKPDILVFLSGEREIREVETHLTQHFKSHTRKGEVGSEVVTLYARQSIEEQERIFAPGVKRRVVLATNVAETSLTVPRIHAVIDPGYARILRYSAKSRVQRLPVEMISQASARQRAGRAGRLAAGMCVRLYSEENFAARAEFTPPEILRTNLASVILQMDALNLGRAEDFPFVDPPSARLLADGRATLVELGASTAEGKLTRVGRAMSLLPLDPRLSRMLLASIDERCTNDVLVVVAGLAVQDPRLRPPDQRDAAEMAQARFRDPVSDFSTFLRMWRIWRTETQELGSSARRRWCEKNFLSHQRMREWVDTVAQLRDVFAEHFALRVGEPSAESDRDPNQGAFHRAVIAGFASHVFARTEKGEYRGVSGALSVIHPSSTLVRRGPNWIVAAEVVETTKRFARICARVQPDWVVRVAPHLCSRVQFEPHFVEVTGQVSAWERTSIGELVVVARKRVAWGPIDPVSARHIFLTEGLVNYRARTRGAFLAANQALREDLEREEARGRRRGLLLEEEAALAFYEARVPAAIHSLPSFEAWRTSLEASDPNALFMRAEDLLKDGALRADPLDFPQQLAVDALMVPLVYTHDPRDDTDGVTARIPVEALALINPAPFEWMVPGVLGEKIDALIRSLPKQLRVRLFPIEEVTSGAIETLDFQRGSLLTRLARHLTAVAGTEITRSDFRVETLAPHLLMRFCVMDADGSELGSGRDLAALAKTFRAVAQDRLRATIDRSSDPVHRTERDTLAAMPDEEIARELHYTRAGIALTGFPALVLETVNGERRVALRVLGAQTHALVEHSAAVAELLARECRDAVEHHMAYHPLCEEVSTLLARASVSDMTHFIARVVAQQMIPDPLIAPRSIETFLVLARALERSLHDSVDVSLRTLHAMLVGSESILARTANIKPDPNGEPRARILARLALVLGSPALEGLARCPRIELMHRLRLIQMLQVRLDRLRELGSAHDADIDAQLEPLRARVREAHHAHGAQLTHLQNLSRMCDEIEISRFAPKLPRAFAASEKRLDALLGGAS